MGPEASFRAPGFRVYGGSVGKRARKSFGSLGAPGLISWSPKPPRGAVQKGFENVHIARGILVKFLWMLGCGAYHMEESFDKIDFQVFP